jgi:ABC-type antimicrobial peptide transport system permease subunit
MFFSYMRHELRRRMRQAVVISLGLALGIGLVIMVTAASSGVKRAQTKVLASLYGVGTDITVTKTPTAGSGGPPGIRFGSPSRSGGSTKVSRDSLTSAGFGTLTDGAVTQISRLKNVSAAAGGLTLTDTDFSGTVASSSSSPGSGGGRSSFDVSSFSVDGVSVSSSTVGPLSSAQLTSGRTFRASDATADVALISSDYAKSKNLKTGSSVTVAGRTFRVIGIISSSSTTDVYIPLARAQALSGMTGEVNTIYVAADSAANISTVAKEISAAQPKATVTTSSDLASEVTGSLSSASSLANNLGKWLAIAVLAVAFALAALLTMSAVSRRVREFGTLKALGWPSRRVIRQVMGESLVIGIIGGLAGIVLGFGGAALVSALAPPLSASTTGAGGTGGAGGASVAGEASGSAAPGGGGLPGRGSGGGGFGSSAAHTVSVHLTAPVTVEIVLLAVVLAVAGGLIAGLFGGWRAARLRPAAALGRVA